MIWTRGGAPAAEGVGRVNYVDSPVGFRGPTPTCMHTAYIVCSVLQYYPPRNQGQITVSNQHAKPGLMGLEGLGCNFTCWALAGKEPHESISNRRLPQNETTTTSWIIHGTTSSIRSTRLPVEQTPDQEPQARLAEQNRPYSRAYWYALLEIRGNRPSLQLQEHTCDCIPT